jgi:hypothetical protein
VCRDEYRLVIFGILGGISYEIGNGSGQEFGGVSYTNSWINFSDNAYPRCGFPLNRVLNNLEQIYGGLFREGS